ncbi:MAG: DNA repair exonuclease, partial [Clostridia bacterium]
MKFIHCADLHLESPLSGLVDGKRRRAELVTAFRNMLEYGYNSGVTAVVIAGDLFDGEYVSNSVILEVADCFLRYPSVQFYLLQGNHDGAKPIDKLRDLTISNLHIFGSEWTYFYQENVCFCGAGKVDKGDYDSVVLDSGKYNCIVLHLDPSSDTYGYLDEKKLNALPVDYVALGHIHAYNSRKCGRGLEVNCGTLEARGFDETTETGFVLVDTTSVCSAKFIPSAIRKVHTFILDVTTCISTSNAIFLLKDLLVSTPKAD